LVVPYEAGANVDTVPDVRGFSSFDFDSVPEMYQRGRQATEEALPAIERLLTASGEQSSTVDL